MSKPHPHLLIEREGAYASVASDLHHMIGHLRAAQHYNRAHNLQLPLPDEKPLLDLIGECARRHKQEKTA